MYSYFIPIHAKFKVLANALPVLVLSHLFSLEVNAQNFLTLLKDLDRNSKNYQVDPERIKFIDAKYDQFTLQNFLDLYNHTYDTSYSTNYSYGYKQIVSELLSNETSVEFNEYIKVNKALNEISEQRWLVLGPINSKIFQLGLDIKGCEKEIKWIRQKAEEIVMKEEEAMNKRIRSTNTLNAISAFAAGFSGNRENLIYHVPPSSALVWWYDWDWSEAGNSIPASMRKKYVNHDVSSQNFIGFCNDGIKTLIEWKNELSAQQVLLEQEYEVNEQKWDKAKSDFITTTFGLSKNESFFLEKALEKKYLQWYTSELTQLRDTFIRKFGAASTDVLFIKQFTLFSNQIKEYYKDMRNYSSYDKDLNISGVSYNNVKSMFEKLKSNESIKNPYFTKIVESMSRFSDYVDIKAEKYFIFKEYAEGKDSDYFYTISRGFMQPSAVAPVKSIESVIIYLDELEGPVFGEIPEKFSLIFKEFEFEKIIISTNYLRDSFSGLKNIKAKNVILYFSGNQLDANELTVFKRLIDIKKLEIHCDCKIKNLKDFQANATFNVVLTSK